MRRTLFGNGRSARLVRSTQCGGLGAHQVSREAATAHGGNPMNTTSLVEERTTKRKARLIRTITRMVAAALGVAAATYAGSAAFTWYRYGTPKPGAPDEADPLLDRFIPVYEVVERHHVRVRAPAPVTLAAAWEQNLLGSPVIRAIFKARELALGSTPDDRARPQALVPQMLALGWGVLAEVPGKEVVMGAVTKPWEPNPRFRALDPERFAAFDEPDYVKIVWSLRADALGPQESIFRTETRAVATDSRGRVSFRRYWALVSHGEALIRSSSLGPLRADAERRARAMSEPAR